MINKRIAILFIVLVSADMVYSGFQYYHTSLDGDLAAIVFPAPEYKEAMRDPFGAGVLVHHKEYAAPNRFFAHWTTSLYFKSMPFLLQNLMSPVSSLYASAALAKLAMHLCLLLLISLFSVKIAGIPNSQIPLAALMASPLFQTFGYNGVMGVILHSISYAFFYTLPLTLLMFYFLLLIGKQRSQSDQRFTVIRHLILIIIAIVLAFNGPVIPGVVIVVTLLGFFKQFFKQFHLQRDRKLWSRLMVSAKGCFIPAMNHLLFILILSVYSLWLGRRNVENDFISIPLIERFYRIPSGLYDMLTNKLGLALLVAALILNWFLTRRFFSDASGKRVLITVRWLMIFSLMYLLLLPFGGYRWYRPDVVRFDTMLPVYLALMIAFVATSIHLLNRLSNHPVRFYPAILTVILIIYQFADGPNWNDNGCERKALAEISQARANQVLTLDSDCRVMSWVIIRETEYSRLNCEMLTYWKVAPPGVLYKQE